jgi:hypothetical protein
MRKKRALSNSLANESETFLNDEQEGIELKDDKPLKFKDEIALDDMTDLFELCKSKCSMK